MRKVSYMLVCSWSKVGRSQPRQLSPTNESIFSPYLPLPTVSLEGVSGTELDLFRLTNLLRPQWTSMA